MALFFKHARSVKKKAQKKILELVPKHLDDLDKALEETVEAMDRGEVEPEDLAWESEFGAASSKREGDI